MRQSRLSFFLIFSLVLFLSFTWAVQPASAGNITLVNNSGTTSSTWFIDGEPTLVINGFDLSPLNLSYPVTIDTVTIAVQQAAAEAVQVVVYEDGNGGSPLDAKLISQTTVTIQSAGVATIRLPNPVTTNAPVLWIGFYLPVGFRFFADESGSSVLTYWGWRDGGTFDLANLGSAGVFGPADGSAPVNINLGGIARITAEITQSGGAGSSTGTSSSGLGAQLAGSEANLSLLQIYPYCGENLRYDPDDIRVTANGRFTIHCRADVGPFSPGTIRNASQLPRNAASYERRGVLYEVFAAGEYQADPTDSERLYVPVTHCLRPEQADLNNAIIGIGYGAPRQWQILPSQRYGEMICAEVTHQGFLSYFVPRVDTPTTLNADLYFSGYPYFEGQSVDVSGDNDLYCGYPYTLRFSVHNEGFEATPQTIVRILLRHDRTGTGSFVSDFTLPSVMPGATLNLSFTAFLSPRTYVNENHTLILTIDPNNNIAERNDGNNENRMTGVAIRPAANC